MTSKERVLAYLERRIPDRVPTSYRATSEVTHKLLAHFGTDDFQVVRRALGIDGFFDVSPVYVGPDLHRFGDGTWEDFWGTRYKNIQYATGCYAEKCFFPLQGARTAEQLDRYRWPSLDWWDFSCVSEQAQRAQDQVVRGGVYSLFEQFNALKPLDECLTDILVEPEFVLDVFVRLHGFWMQYLERLFQAAEGAIKMLFISDDVGMQDRMMMRPDVWRGFFPPFYRELTAMAHRYGVSVAYHSDGSIDPIIPDLIEAGADILEPVQHVCPGIDREHLKAAYGDRLLFMGAVENQRVLPFGTVEEVREETRECLRLLAKGGGYMLSSCHNLQPVTPVENIIAMYQVVQEEGHLYF
ncbi:MAG TPA: uroporphyrinogen decarboxylase family protein [bacterium]|nr:uroporphyrinogen decarboxylase family protein [bacterium]